MNLLDPPLPRSVIESVTASLAHLYRVIPIATDGKQLTFAATQPLTPVMQDELRTLLGVSVRGVVVRDDVFDAALHHYYPEAAIESRSNPGAIEVLYPLDHEYFTQVRKLSWDVVRIVMQADVSEVRLISSEDGTALEITRASQIERVEQFANPELGIRLSFRFSVMASMDTRVKHLQSERIELTVGGEPVLIEVQCKSENDTRFVTLRRNFFVHKDDFWSFGQLYSVLAEFADDPEKAIFRSGGRYSIPEDLANHLENYCKLLLEKYPDAKDLEVMQVAAEIESILSKKSRGGSSYDERFWTNDGFQRHLDWDKIRQRARAFLLRSSRSSDQA